MFTDATKNELNISNIEMKTREEFVTDALRQAILRGQFRPGDKLDQQELAEQLGVSRSPVREALRTLMAEDLVTQYPHKGAFVTSRSVDELKEILIIRSKLEGAAAERAAPLMDNARLSKLADIIAEAGSTEDIERVLSLNNDFHAIIYAAFPQPHLIDLVQRLRNKVAPYNRIYLDLEGKKESAWSDHEKIYKACVKRDGTKAKEETQKHLEQVFEGILTSLDIRQ